jgi:chromosome segregation ATPase
MNPYENCIEQQERMKALSQRMNEAYELMESALDRADELSLDIPKNTQDLEALKGQAEKAYKEITELGKQRLDAFYQWVDCLHRNISN